MVRPVFIRRLGLANDDIKLGNSTQGQSEIRKVDDVMATAKSTHVIGQGQLDICSFCSPGARETPIKISPSRSYPLKVVGDRR